MYAVQCFNASHLVTVGLLPSPIFAIAVVSVCFPSNGAVGLKAVG